MSKFPAKKIPFATDFYTDYMNEISAASKLVSGTAFQEVANSMVDVFSQNGVIYVCGNGGSAEIANHMTCDFMKCIQTDTSLRPRVISLANTSGILTAIANDIEYADVFAYQLRTLIKPEDALMTISSSGNSENVVRAIRVANEHSISSYALTGFSGGRSANEAQYNLHVPTDNYGVIEDVHQTIIHALAQYIRMQGISANLIADRVF